MLKRQRPSSPPPSIASIPLIDDSSHGFKRRRILPPVLDGPSRGWATPREEDIYEDNDTSDEEEENITTTCNPDVVEYKSANTVLRELHTSNQHRLMHTFTSPPRNASRTPTHFVDPYPHSHPIFPSKSHLPPLPNRLRTQTEAKVSSSPDDPPSNNSDETNIVTQRYEDTNRLLGSLFLSRRRQLSEDPG